MVKIERELDRYLTLLGNKIRDRGFTQLEVQEPLGWGRSYISQLVTKQKSLKLEQVLLILNVIGVEPARFFAELYDFSAGSRGQRTQRPRLSHATPSPAGTRLPTEELIQLQRLLQGLTNLLRQKNVISERSLREAVEAARLEPRLTQEDIVKRT